MKTTSLLLMCSFGLAGLENTSAQPMITTHPRSITVNAGATASFTAIATSSSPMTYQWRFRDEAIPIATNSALRVENAGIANLGAYSVQVTDASGSVDSQAAHLSLDVTLSPPFVPNLNISSASEGLAISWRGEGIVQAADSPNGPWANVGGTRKNFLLATNSSTAAFYRLRNPHPRNARLYIPSTYRPGTLLPVIFSLHRFNGDANVMESFVRLRALAESEGFLYVLADGVANPSGNRFWNAAAGCCDFASQEIDDVGFFRELIMLLQAGFDADPRRVHFVGHSNGGFMAYRMAQEHSELIASIASIAGAMDRESSLPPPNHPVSVLEIHGTQDTIIPYNGGSPSGITGLPSNPVPVTSARESVQRWADWNGCSSLQDDPAESLDLDSNIAGLDTLVTRSTNCQGGLTVELWTIENGGHFAAFTTNFARELVNWLLNHPKVPVGALP